MKFRTKKEFVETCETEWNALWELVGELRRRNNRRIDQKVRDTLAHLYAWHRLLLNWIKIGEQGRVPDLPATGFNWRQTPALNQALHKEYFSVEFESIIRRIKRSHRQILNWVSKLPEKKFLQAGVYHWTGKLPLSSYVAPNTVSHYRWAKKKLKSL